MCGRFPFGKDVLRSLQIGQVQSCVRPIYAAFATIVPDGIRGSGPYLLSGLERPGLKSGCPDPRPDRFAIPSHRPRNG